MNHDILLGCVGVIYNHVLGDELMFGLVVCSDYLEAAHASLCVMCDMLEWYFDLKMLLYVIMAPHVRQPRDIAMDSITLEAFGITIHPDRLSAFHHNATWNM